MGYVWKIPVSEKQVAESVQSAAVNERFKKVTESLEAEQATRLETDEIITSDTARLWSALADEITLRANDDLTLHEAIESQVTAEQTARQTQDELLLARVNSETSMRQAALLNLREEMIAADSALLNTVNNKFDPLISDVQKSISDEATLSASRDETLAAKLIESITAEQSARQSADNSLQTSLQAEQAARVQADTAIQTSLQAEQSARTSAITSAKSELQTAINNEVSLRSSADSKLQSSLASAKSDLTTAINNEATLRASQVSNVQSSLTSAKSELQTAINNEVTLRASQISNVQSSLASAKTDLTTAINNEATLRASQVSNVQSSLTSAKSELQTAINNEVTLRASQVSNVQSSLASAKTDLTTAINNEATLRASQINQVQASISSGLASVQAGIKDFTPSTSVKAGAAGLVPAPPKSSNKMLLTQNGWEELASTDIFIGAIPSQNGTLTYTGGTLSPSWLNFEDQKLQVGGTTSATNAGNYTATFTPIGLYCWGDGTRAAKSVTWTIQPKTATVPYAAVTSYTFKGSAITLGVSNPNSDCTSQTGTVSATNAGNYTATYKLKSTSNYIWSDGTTTDKSISWNITAKSLSIPTASTTSFDYKGSAITLTVSGYDSNAMSQTGTVSATNAGNYTATYKLKSTSNYIWSDGTTTDKSISWSIKKLVFTIPTASTTSFDYKGSTIALTISNYNSTYMTQSGDASATNAGNYSVSFALKDTSNYIWSDNSTTAKSISWSIKKLVFTIPTANPATYTFTGSAISLKVDNYDSNYMSQTGTVSATNAGAYSATYKLRSTTNYIWKDNTSTDKTVAWSITAKSVAIPTANTSEYEYTGSTVTLSVSNFDSTAMSQTGTASAINADTYTATYKLKSTTNFVWSDKSTTDKSIVWKIIQKSFAKPTANSTSFTYNKSEQGPIFSNYDSAIMTKTGTDTAIVVGNYSTTFALKESSYKWTDNTTANVKIDWAINLLKLVKPTAKTSSFTYNGNSQALVVNNFNANYEEVSGTTSAIQAGNYSATYKLSDTTNTKWSDNTTANVVIGWTIARKALTATQSTLAQKTALTYNGNSQALTLTNYNSTFHTLSSTTSATNAGTYTAKVTPTSNYCWNDGATSTKSITWTIDKKTLTAPTAATTSFNFTGQTITLDVDGYDSTTMSRTGTVSASNAGTYSATYLLRDTTNYKWNSTATSIVITWTINKTLITKPTITAGASQTFGDTFPLTISGYDSTVMSQSGTKSAFNAGDYSITYSLKDKTNTAWEDGTSNDVVLTWTVARLALPRSFSDVAQKGTLTYDGNAQSVKLNNAYDPNNLTLSGTTSATNAGTYTAKVTPKANYCWNDGTTAAKSVQWSIGKRSNAKPTAATTTFEYDGAEKTLSISNYNSARMTQTGTTSASGKGNYSVTFALNDTDNEQWSDKTTANVVINWSITAKVIPAPTVSGVTSFTFDGKTHSITVNGYDSSTMTFSGSTSAINAGNYSAKYALNDPSNSVWDNGSTDTVTFSWSIARAKLTAAQSTGFSLDITEDYPTITLQGSCAVPSYSFSTSHISNFDSNYHSCTVESSNKLVLYQSGAPVTYTIKVTPAANYCWNNGTTSAFTFTFKLKRVQTPKPTLTAAAFSYTGETISPVQNFVNKYMAQSGTASATNVGDYSVTYSLRKSAIHPSLHPYWVEWEDGTIGDVTLTWQITQGGITKPSLASSSFEWTGGNISPTINNFNANVITKSGSDTAVAVGNYSITFALKDKSNTTWADGTSNDLTLTWKITRQKLSSTLSSFSQKTALTYSGNAQEVTLTNYNSTYHSLNSTTSATNAGTYTVKVSPTSNYCWSDGTTAAKSVQWSIGKMSLTKPSLTNSSFTYDSNAHSPTINNFNSTYETYSGSDTATNAGSYSITFALKSTANTQWADSSTSNVATSWSINKATPTLTFNVNSVTLDNDTSSTTVTAIYSGDGTLSASSNNTSVANVSASGTSITVRANLYSSKTATITVTASAGDNYAAKSATFSVTSSFIPEFNKCTWAQISEIIRAGKAQVAWQVGDTKGAARSITDNYNYTFLVRILEFRPTVVTNPGSLVDTIHCIVFAAPGVIFSGAVNNYPLRAFITHNYGLRTTDEDYQATDFDFVHATSYKRVDYSDSNMRKICTDFYEGIEDEDLKAIIQTRPVKYGISCTGTFRQWDKVWLFDVGEVFGFHDSDFDTPAIDEPVYEYFANGNSSVAYRRYSSGDSPNEYADWWTRTFNWTFWNENHNEFTYGVINHPTSAYHQQAEINTSLGAIFGIVIR